MAERIKAELLTGTYQREMKVAWRDFVEAYMKNVATNNRSNSLKEIRRAFRNVERILKPKLVASVTSERIASFVTKRREERGKKPGSKVSPTTVNCDLRNLKAALNVAHEWGMIDSVPKIRLLKEPKKLPTFVSAEHFAAMYRSAEIANKPREVPYPFADWWRALLVTA